MSYARASGGSCASAPGEHGQRTGSGHRRRTVAAGRGGLRPRARLVHWRWLDSFGRRCRISAVTAAGGSWEALRRLGSRPMDGRLRIGSTGCGAAWLARLLWEQEAAGSNPAIPTNLRHCRSWHASPRPRQCWRERARKVFAHARPAHQHAAALAGQEPSGGVSLLSEPFPAGRPRRPSVRPRSGAGPRSQPA